MKWKYYLLYIISYYISGDKYLKCSVIYSIRYKETEGWVTNQCVCQQQWSGQSGRAGSPSFCLYLPPDRTGPSGTQDAVDAPTGSLHLSHPLPTHTRMAKADLENTHSVNELHKTTFKVGTCSLRNNFVISFKLKSPSYLHQHRCCSHRILSSWAQTGRPAPCRYSPVQWLRNQKLLRQREKKSVPHSRLCRAAKCTPSKHTPASGKVLFQETRYCGLTGQGRMKEKANTMVRQRNREKKKTPVRQWVNLVKPRNSL